MILAVIGNVFADYAAAKDNEKIGNMYNHAAGAKTKWQYHTTKTLEDALTRARTVAAPINQQRFLRKTPCAVTGTCADCKSPECICNQIVITRHCRPAERIRFILVGEELGF